MLLARFITWSSWTAVVQPALVVQSVKVYLEVMGRLLRVSEEGLKRTKEAFHLTGWTQDYLASSVKCTRSTIKKFWARGYVEKCIFEAICSELNLTLGEIVEWESEEEQYSKSLGSDGGRGQTLQKNTSDRSGSIKKILVIEDEVFIRENLLELIDEEIEGFDAVGAENRIEGVRLVKDYQPDFIFCDVMMPEIDGYVDLKALREDSALAKIPFRFVAVGKTLLVRFP